MKGPTTDETLAYLKSPEAVRERCQEIAAYVISGQSKHFTYHERALERTTQFVIDTILESYPDLDIPFHSRWRHFDSGAINRNAKLAKLLAPLSAREQARSHYDLVIISVLLDAGAGPRWKYHDSESKEWYVRSEGLAVASFNMFVQGLFSGEANHPYQVDARGLLELTKDQLGKAFQVTGSNPLLGLDGRHQLLQRLAATLKEQSPVFGAREGRLGFFSDHLVGQASRQQISAKNILISVINTFQDIWPSRLSLEGRPLGDVWHHHSIKRDDQSAGLVPFHKLSQWLTYSLLEPLEMLNYQITDLDLLTGLPEYRNGGLFLDFKVLELKDPSAASRAHPVSSEIVVEWRAMTVVLLDEVAARIRRKLARSSTELPLVKILQGGTWSSGRRIAVQLRKGGAPPLNIESDGTVF